MTEKKIGEIQAEYKAIDDDKLTDFIDRYHLDERPGVQKICLQAKKRHDKYLAELDRIFALKEFERKYSSSYSYICGIDEAGRGPLCGPVVAGAVIFPEDTDILYINDSKKLSEAKREELYDVILEKAIAVGIGIASPEEIDEMNILQATYKAMREAVSNLSVEPDLLLNDAVTIPGLSMTQVPIIKGDAKSISIGAASIIAKVTRDRMMLQYDEIFPGYGFAKHKGYGTREHIDAIRRLGPTPIHRKTFISNFI